MNILHGNLWHHLGEYDAFCITTNGMVKRNGEVVMGAGIAKQAKERFKDLPRVLGAFIRLRGNEPHLIDMQEWFKQDVPLLISFPVKHHWKDKADLELIEISANLLKDMIDRQDFEKVALPAPGVGNGKRSWEHEVKPILEKVFGDDDRIDIWFYR